MFLETNGTHPGQWRHEAQEKMPSINKYYPCPFGLSLHFTVVSSFYRFKISWKIYFHSWTLDSTLDEACEQEACSDDWKRKDSLIQNRTIYTPRQSNALEQGLFYCILCLIILFCSVQFHSISIHSILINAFFKYYFSVNCSVLSESICRYVHKGETISENTPSRG